MPATGRTTTLGPLWWSKLPFRVLTWATRPLAISTRRQVCAASQHSSIYSFLLFILKTYLFLASSMFLRLCISLNISSICRLLIRLRLFKTHIRGRWDGQITCRSFWPCRLISVLWLLLLCRGRGWDLRSGCCWYWTCCWLPSWTILLVYLFPVPFALLLLLTLGGGKRHGIRMWTLLVWKLSISLYLIVFRHIYFFKIYIV